MSAARAKITESEIQLMLAFAKLELVELQAGTRTLTQCPGLKNVAKAIAAAELELAQRLEQLNNTTEGNRNG